MKGRPDSNRAVATNESGNNRPQGVSGTNVGVETTNATDTREREYDHPESGRNAATPSSFADCESAASTAHPSTTREADNAAYAANTDDVNAAADCLYADEDLESEIRQLECLLLQSQQAISQIHGEVVLVIGSTGVGKSTFINYLNDNIDITRSEDTEESYVSVRHDHADSPVISQLHAGSCTIFPRAHQVGKMTFIDTAGFADTRGMAHDISVHSSLLQILKTVKIKAVIMLLSSGLSAQNRGAGYVSAVKALENIIGHNIEAYHRNVFYIVNQSLDLAEPRNSSQIQTQLTKMMNAFHKSAHQSEKNMAYYMERILRCNVRSFSPKDDSRVRNDILHEVRACTPIVGSQELHMSQFGSYTDRLYKIGERIASRFVSNHVSLQSKGLSLLKHKEQLTESKAELHKLDLEIRNVKEKLQSSPAEYNGQAICKQKIEEYNAQIGFLRKKIAQCVARQHDLTRQNTRLMNDDTKVVVGSRNYRESGALKKSGEKLIVREVVKHIHIHTGYEIIDVDEDYTIDPKRCAFRPGGKLTRLKSKCDREHRKRGYNKYDYFARYNGPSHINGSYTVKVFTFKKFTAENLSSIEVNKRELARQDSLIKSYNAKISMFSGFIKTAHEQSLAFAVDGAKNLGRYVQEKEKERLKQVEVIRDSQLTVMNSTGSLLQTRQALFNNAGKIRMLHRLVVLIPEALKNVSLVPKMMTLLGRKYYASILTGGDVCEHYFDVNHPLFAFGGDRQSPVASSASSMAHE